MEQAGDVKSALDKSHQLEEILVSEKVTKLKKGGCGERNWWLSGNKPQLSGQPMTGKTADLLLAFQRRKRYHGASW